MSDTSTVAVAVIVDSSLVIASQWVVILAQYISPLLSRLIENRPSEQLQIGFVTYATADFRPTPILAKRYFNVPQQVHRELKDEYMKLGIGRSGTGGKNGMAALEGYAAALEMFDLFLRSAATNGANSEKSAPDSQPVPICHIIHVSSSVPDGSRNPIWNQTSDLDALSWKTMPDELRKRNINLSMVLLRPSQPLSELHNSIVNEPGQAWFPVRPGHTVLLSAQSCWLSNFAKRPVENKVPDSSVDAKRVRVAPPDALQTPPMIPAPNPNSAPPPSASTSNAVPVVAGPSAPPPAPPVIRPIIGAQPPNLSSIPQPVIQLMQKMKMIENMIKQQFAEVNAAVQEGRVQDAEDLKKSLQHKHTMYAKLKSYAIMYTKASQANAGANKPLDTKAEDASVQPPTARQAVENQTAGAGPSSVLQPPPSTTQSLPLNDQQALAQLIQSHVQQAQSVTAANKVESGNLPGGAGPRSAPNVLANIPPDVAAQMQKLVGREGIPGQVQVTSTQSQPPSQQPGNTGQMSSSPNPSIPNPGNGVQPQTLLGRVERQRWMGTITWTGREKESAPNIKMEAQVIAQGTSGSEIRPELWPQMLSLVPSSEHAVPMQDLRDWILRHKPQVCSLTTHARTVDAQENARHFRSLIGLLFDKSLYAIGSWPLSSSGDSTPKPTVLIFPTGNKENMAAAVFPETGIPEFPKASGNHAMTLPVPHSGGLQYNSGTDPQGSNASPGKQIVLPPNLAANIATMNPQQQRMYIAALQHMRRQQIMQAQASQSGQVVGGGANGSNSGGSLGPGLWAGNTQGGSMNMVGSSTSPQPGLGSPFNPSSNPNIGSAGPAPEPGFSPQNPNVGQAFVPGMGPGGVSNTNANPNPAMSGVGVSMPRGPPGSTFTPEILQAFIQQQQQHRKEMGGGGPL